MSKLTDNMYVERANLLINWLHILTNGRVRPDDPKIAKELGLSSANTTGVVRDSNDFREDIKKINAALTDILL
jgi:ribosomal protein L30/L7E